MVLLQLQLVSMDGLLRELDGSQLPAELEGCSFPYNHSEWIEVRLLLEQFEHSSRHLRQRLMALVAQLESAPLPLPEEGPCSYSKAALLDLLRSPTFPSDSSVARQLTMAHQALRPHIEALPLDRVQQQGFGLLNVLRYGSLSYAGARVGDPSQPSSSTNSSSSSSTSTSAASASGVNANALFAMAVPSWLTLNADLQRYVPIIEAQLASLADNRNTLLHRWAARRQRLEQIYQLRLFEEDSAKVRARAAKLRSIRTPNELTLTWSDVQCSVR